MSDTERMAIAATGTNAERTLSVPRPEPDFEADLAPEKIQTTRVSAVLAAVLYALFGILDIWAIPSALQWVLAIRATVLLLLGAVFLSTYRPFFVRHYTAIMTVMYLGVGGGIEVMIALSGPTELARNIYYSGLILVVYALYTWTYVSATVSLSIGLGFVSTYLWIAIAVQHMGNAQEWPVLLANAFFFISASTIGFVGGGMRNRFARENFRLRNALEKELEHTIAERRESELAYLRKLEDSEALKSAIIDTAPVSLVTTDAAGRILDFNPQAELCFGDERSSAIGRQLTDYVDWSEPADRAAARSRALAELTSAPMEAVGIRADGCRFPIEIAVANTRRPEDGIFTAFIVDLTPKRQAEEEIRRQREALYQREKLAAMGSLLAGVAHELNNPLAVVVGRSLLLEEQIGMGPQRDAVGKIRQAAERCARIVKTFLSMARQQRSERRHVDLHCVIGAALDMLAYSLRTAGVELSVHRAPRTPWVQGDEDQLHQVFMNLFVNAQQAMADRPGPRQLEVCTRIDAEAGLVCATVSDSGPGIAPEHRSRVFEPYFTTKPQGQGTGVGLAVCLGIVESHGGSLTLENPKLGGARFIVKLPLSRELAPLEATGTAKSAEFRPACASSTIPTQACERRLLVVDDEPELAEMLREILAPLGASIDFAANGREALVRLEQASYDAILSDLRMPEMDGPSLHREIAKRWPVLGTRMVFITGDSLTAGLSSFLAQSACPVIEKPFDAGEVRSHIARLLGAASNA